VTNVTSKRTCAFGELNIPNKQVEKDLLRALKKAQELSKLKCSKNTDSLRRRFAKAMGLDVIFSPRLIEELTGSKWPKSRLPVHRRWTISPVWRTAPKGAYGKANRLCNLLHLIVDNGFSANILRLLVRMSIHIWKMSQKDFYGLCRKISARIAQASKASSRSMPDPLKRSGTLISNPVSNDCDNRNPVRITHNIYCYGMRVKHAPGSPGVLASLLNHSAWAEDSKRVISLRETWFAPQGLRPVRGRASSRSTMR